MGFGDTVDKPAEDPIGISNVWLHVHKEIFENYWILGNRETWDDILAGYLLLCGAHYTLVGQGRHVKEFCDGWTCGQVVSKHCAWRVGWGTTRKTRKRWKCRRCLDTDWNIDSNN